MMTWQRRRVAQLAVLASVATGLAAAGPAAGAAPRTVVAVDLGVGAAEVINDHGQVAGTFRDTAGRDRAFLWTPGAGRQDLGGLGGTFLRVTGMNERGVVVGYGTTPSGALQAFRYARATGFQGLGADSVATAVNDGGTAVGAAGGAAVAWEPSGRMHTILRGAQADDINDAGQVVGSIHTDSTSRSVAHLFLWTRAGGARDLGRPDVPGDAFDSFGLQARINARGQVAGTYTRLSDTHWAFRWTSQDGFTLLADTPQNHHGHAQSIDDAGTVAGVLAQGSDIHAFRWSSRDGLQDLGVVSRDWHEHGVFQVNARGDVSGAVYPEGSPRRVVATLWTPSTGMRELGALDGGISSDAAAINAAGQVAGWSDTANGERHATLWKP